MTFVFTRPAYELTFFLGDIDASATSYQDYVAICSTPGETPTSAPGSLITVAGTLTNPWRSTGGSDETAVIQTVKVTYSNGFVGMTSLSRPFWLPVLPVASVAHVLRVRQMRFRTCV